MPRGVGRDIISGLLGGGTANYQERKKAQADSAKSSTDLKNDILLALIKAKVEQQGKPTLEQEIEKTRALEQAKAEGKIAGGGESSSIFDDPNKFAMVMSLFQGKPIPGLNMENGQAAAPTTAPQTSAAPGAIPGVSDALGVKGGTVDSTGKLSLSLGETPSAQASREVGTQAAKDVKKREIETQEGFQRTVGLFRNLVGQFKSKIEAQGGKGGIGAGIKGMFSSAMKKEGSAPIEAFEGQKQETALALNGIITGQNRVIKGVVEMIQKTLPTRFDTPEFAAQKIAQSISNSFRLKKAVDDLQLTPDILEGMNEDQIANLIERTDFSPEEQTFIDGLIADILATPPAEQATMDIGVDDEIAQLEAEIAALEGR